MSTFEQYAQQYTQILNESKAEEIIKLLRTGTLTKAQVAKAVGANYSQVHTIAKKMISGGEIEQPPMGKKGRSSAGSSKPPIKKPPVAAKAVKATRPVGVKSSKSDNPTHAKIDQVVLHMIGVIDDPTYSDLVTAAAEAIPAAMKDQMTSADAEQLVRDRVKALAAAGEIFQNRDTGVFSLTPAGEEDLEADEDDGDDSDVLAFKNDDDDDDTSGWMKDYFDSGRKSGGYHL